MPKRRRPVGHTLAAILACTTLSSGGAVSQVLNERLKLVPQDGAPFDRFGRDVALHGGLALVGAPLDDDRGDAAGSAYLFELESGQQVDKLLARDPRTGETFGQADDNLGDSVALAGDTALLGALQKDEAGTFSGAAYLFSAPAGVQLERLLPFSPPPFSPTGSAFGADVALSADGSRAAIGAPGDTGTDEQGANGGGGAMYVYHNIEETMVKVYASDAAFADNFGTAVAITSQLAAASAPFDDDNGTDSGSVYLFDADSGEEIEKLRADDGAAQDFFGFSLAATEAYIAIGAPFDDNAMGDSAGAVYLFDALTYTQIGKFMPATPSAGALLGFDVALDGDTLVAGGTEMVTVFDLASGRQLFELQPSDPADEQFFGSSVAVHGSLVIVGAEGDETNGERSGAAYVFDLEDGAQAPAVSVASITAGEFERRSRLGAEVTVLVQDQGGDPVPNATVRVRIRGGINELAAGRTDTNGRAVLRSRRAVAPPLTFQACVINIVAQVPYVSEDNNQTCTAN